MATNIKQFIVTFLGYWAKNLGWNSSWNFCESSRNDFYIFIEHRKEITWEICNKYIRTSHQYRVRNHEQPKPSHFAVIEVFMVHLSWETALGLWEIWSPSTGGLCLNVSKCLHEPDFNCVLYVLIAEQLVYSFSNSRSIIQN